jgi:hypothetical protein
LTADPVRRIADAVLYEGYILWPYRKSALKNQQRWTFGGVYPDDPSAMQTECLLEGGCDTAVDVQVRFLHVVERQVLEAGPDGLEPVEELEVEGERHVSWQEAVERELGAEGLQLCGLDPPRRLEIRIPAGARREDLRDAAGTRVGAVSRSWQEVEGAVEIHAERIAPALFRLGVGITNSSRWSGGSREEALLQTFCSTHTILTARDGSFASLTDPPEELREAAAACVNAGTWPVLVGEDGDRSRMLSSPIILPDYPQVAPESPGDLFDATEIDQMLVLNILSLTDEEKREMRDSDPRAREILERTEALTEEELMKLHGAIREFGLARRP